MHPQTVAYVSDRGRKSGVSSGMPMRRPGDLEAFPGSLCKGVIDRFTTSPKQYLDNYENMRIGAECDEQQRYPRTCEHGGVR